MYATTYHRPKSIEEAGQLASEEAMYLSGGQTLLPTMKQRLAAPESLIDLRHIDELKGISVEGRKVRIGAATTHFEVASSDALAKVCPGLCHLASLVGDPAVRHMGTIGGSIANNDPAADYPAGLLGLGATIITNQRSLSADAFFTGLFETALEEGELVTAVEFEAPEKAGYAKFRNPASRYAITGVFVARLGDGSVRVAVTGSGADGVFRHSGMEEALAGNFAAEAIDGTTVDAGALMSDLHASAEYRANLVKVMAKRAVQDAR
ncbi:FAD binding domain-containing protein [Pseudohoeflea coraliihabitans]|uniref:Xanthine dehydrogenase family protein subunit M n=1 Tax=Pseudohoeflea coraliihabitans TaxID=2860393 RepID=A0ABS6WKT6_9HYPH|nr:xanthine dehydrogenase family protein subunit M [Pseudohoeflea sp. DP4N28-3]MBW3096563.1 xanthine dehydrogenase family protein subunit M [Pseudohoeflea sp. DP4N28-3]